MNFPRFQWLKNRFVPVAWLVLVLSAPGALVLSTAQDAGSGEFRQFTNKEGRMIEARILGISPDRKTLTIGQRDGREFELEIVLLSLDDQQFLRQWIANRPATADYRLEVAIDKILEKSTEKRRDRGGFYRFSSEYPQYRITVTNLSRETVPGPVVEYCLLYREKVSIRYDEEERDWEFSSFSLDGGKLNTVRAEIPLEDLVYNREQAVVTESVEIDHVIGDGNYIYGEDELVGLILRVKDSSGTPIGESWRSSDTGIAHFTWESAIGEEDPTAALPDDTNSMPTLVQPRTYELTPGEEYRRKIAIEGMTFSIRTIITPDALKPDGMIAAMGGKAAGWALMIRDRRIVFAARASEAEVREVIASLPSSSAAFEVNAAWGKDELSLAVTGLAPVTGPSPGLVEESPNALMTAGYSGDEPVTSGYEAPFTFPGGIDSVEVTLSPAPGQP